MHRYHVPCTMELQRCFRSTGQNRAASHEGVVAEDLSRLTTFPDGPWPRCSPRLRRVATQKCAGARTAAHLSVNASVHTSRAYRTRVSTIAFITPALVLLEAQSLRSHALYLFIERLLNGEFVDLSHWRGFLEDERQRESARIIARSRFAWMVCCSSPPTRLPRPH